MKKAYMLGMLVGVSITLAVIGGAEMGRATDTTSAPDPKTAARSSDSFRILTGVIADGEQVPIPAEADTGAVQVFLSIREIQDNNEILGRIECRLEADGRTARVRNVNVFTGEVVKTGTANYLVLSVR